MSPLRELRGGSGCEYTLLTCPVMGTTVINTLPSPTGPALVAPRTVHPRLLPGLESQDEDGEMEAGQASSNSMKVVAKGEIFDSRTPNWFTKPFSACAMAEALLC